MSNAIERKAELLICGIVEGADFGFPILPSKGGSLNSDAKADGPILPPFAVAQATGSTNLVAGEDTWKVSMVLTLASHIDDTETPQHTQAFGRLVATILGVPVPGADPAIGITLHGIGLPEYDTVQDEERQSAGDVVAFDMVVTGGEVAGLALPDAVAPARYRARIVIGNGEDAELTITHGLATGEIASLIVRENQEDGILLKEGEYTASIGEDSVTLTFPSAPAENSLVLILLGYPA